MGSYDQLSCCVCGTLFPLNYLPLLVLHIFPPPLFPLSCLLMCPYRPPGGTMQISERWGERGDMYIPFRAECPIDSYSMHIDQKKRYILISLCCKWRHLWWKLRNAQSMNITIHVIRSHFDTMCLLQTNNIRFSPRAYGLSSHYFLAPLTMPSMSYILWGIP